MAASLMGFYSLPWFAKLTPNCEKYANDTGTVVVTKIICYKNRDNSL